MFYGASKYFTGVYISHGGSKYFTEGRNISRGGGVNNPRRGLNIRRTVYMFHGGT